MAAYVGGRRHMTDFNYNRRFPDSITNRRLHYDDDFDLNDNRRCSSRNRQWNRRRSFSERELEGDFIDARDTKLSTLQHHLEELQQDNRQMSLRLSEAEGCLQDLDSNGRMVHHSTSLIDDFGHSVNGQAAIDRKHRLRRELNEIRDDLNAVRGSIQQPFTDDDHLYYDGRRHLSSPERRRRMRHFRNYDDSQLGEWGSKQLEQNTWTRQGSDLDPYYGGRRSCSPVRSFSPMARSSSCVGYRSVVPRPLVTQRNKFQYSPLTSRRFDAGYMSEDDAVFVPSSAADLSIGCRVKVSRNGGTSHGIVKYIGHLPGKVGPYLGLELENEAGKHDGIYNGFRYFQRAIEESSFLSIESYWPGGIKDAQVVMLPTTSPGQ